MKVVSVILSVCLLSLTKALKWSDEYIDNFDKFESISHVAVFEEWSKAFDRTYSSPEEEAHKFLVWLDNWYNILKHNHNSKRGNYTLRLNQFGDMTGDEFRYYVHGKSGSCLNGHPEKTRVINPGAAYSSNKGDAEKKVNANPSTVDWRTKGVVTPVKNQGSCGSCWAFSTTGSLECRYAIAEATLNDLSEQQLVDCSDSYGNDGCNGGLMDNAFKYIEATGGLCTEAAYPYTGADGKCKESTCGTKYNPISTYTDVTKDNEADLETATTQGCVSVAIEADQFDFQYYSGGVLDGSCGTSLDHGVLVVGYTNVASQSAGVGAAAESYWIVKNSWGATWGEAGYVYICKNCDKNGSKGECGIDEEPSYPDTK